jgi:hypothetical protein
MSRSRRLPSPFSRRLWQLMVALSVAAALTTWWASGPARASSSQVSIIQDDPLLLSDPVGFLTHARDLGATDVRMMMRWQLVAPAADSFRRPRFNAADPAAYPASAWAPYDAAVQAAHGLGVGVDLDVLGGAPLWAAGPGMPRRGAFPYHNWAPSAKEFGLFVRAVATRYSGDYDPRNQRTEPGNPADLPRVSFWSIWNEPNYGPSLAPQAVPGHPGVEESPRIYRGLLDAAWSALQATRHGSDTIIWGEFAPRGTSGFGNFNGMTPLRFLRAMYCVDARLRPLRGRAASLRGCPTSASGSSAFARSSPALFSASGVSDHPYMRWYAPNNESASFQPPHFKQLLGDYTTLATIGHLETGLTRLTSVYGHRRVFPVWSTEFGYITDPPKNRAHGASCSGQRGGKPCPYVSQATAALYDNWAEYLSWRDPRIASFDQYLLQDPEPAIQRFDYGGFASGLENYNGTPKLGYGAWRMPLFMPEQTGSRPAQTLEVWGAARPAHYGFEDAPTAPEKVLLLFKPSGTSTYSVLDSVALRPGQGYFDVRERFPSSGTLETEWSYPAGSLLAPSGTAVTSRPVQVTVK